ncbi:hypothetical protein C4E22_01790 [ANME-1 cluster archaeon AG-394-G06]|nr:hypothetical protein [ANME-1 cluster archaeon AG-394-G06]
MNRFVSIILPTYNRANILERCINSVLAQSYSDWELIISDDGSEDNTQIIAKKYEKKDSRVRYHRNAVCQGLPRNRNVAVSISQGDLIFFIEDDLILEQNCLEILVKTFEELEQRVPVGAIAPRLIDDRDKKDYFQKKDIHKACVIDKKTGRIYNNFGLESDVLQECPSLHACSLIPKSVFEDVGGYEENRYKGTYTHEEHDFYFQVKKRGYKLYFQSKAITYHKHVDSGGCRVNNLLASECYSIRNRTLFSFKFYGIRSIYMIFFNILLIFLNTLKYIFRKEKR